jgi:hypothetical protein
MTPLTPIPARLPPLAPGRGGLALPQVVAPHPLAGVKRPASLSTAPARHCVGGFSGREHHPRRKRAISGPDCFGRPTRPNGGCFNRGTLAAGNASGTPFVMDCLSHASVRSCHRAEATGGAA